MMAMLGNAASFLRARDKDRETSDKRETSHYLQFLEDPCCKTVSSLEGKSEECKSSRPAPDPTETRSR